MQRIGDQWAMYYTATSEPTGGNHIVAYRTSADLIDWGDQQVAFEHPQRGTFAGPTDSPFVVQQGDSWYLFVCCGEGTDYGAQYDETTIYRSSDPLPSDFAGQVATINAHGGEAVQDGVYLAPLDFDTPHTGEVVATPYYRAVIETSPETVITELRVDPEGQGDYRRALDDDYRATGLYMAVGGFGNTDRPGPAASVESSTDGRTLMLSGIPMGRQPITVDWELTFDETIDLSYDWHVDGPTTGLVREAAWNWDTVLPRYGEPGAPSRGIGDGRGFADWSIAHDDDVTLVAAYLNGSAWLEDNRFYAPGNSVAWQPFWQPGGRVFAEGDYEGGTWRLGASGQGGDTASADALHAELNAEPPR